MDLSITFINNVIFFSGEFFYHLKLVFDEQVLSH